MNRSMITAVNTMGQLQKQLDIISHNMSNSQTDGFKRREVTFSDMVAQQFNNQPIRRLEIGRQTPHGIRQGVGAKIDSSKIVLTQGTVKATDRQLDFAFAKENQFLKVLVRENGQSDIRFTRQGATYLSPVGPNEMMLVTAEGHPVLDENENVITVNGEPTGFAFTASGQFQASYPNGRTRTANLGIISVQKPQFMEQKGGALIGLPEGLNPNVNQEDIYTELRGADRADISIQGGALEASNVDMSQEMTELINVQRAYQFHSRTVTLADQMMGLVNGIR